MTKISIVSGFIVVGLIGLYACGAAAGLVPNPFNWLSIGDSKGELPGKSDSDGAWSCWGGNPEHSFVVAGKFGKRRVGPALWTLECGATPDECAISNGRLFLRAEIGPDFSRMYRGLHAIDVATGKPVWKQPATTLVGAYESAVVATLNASGSPDGPTDLICYDQKDGTKIWSRSFGKIEYRALLRGNDLAVADTDSLTLLDARSGDVRWKVAADIPFTTAQLLIEGNSVVCVGFTGMQWRLLSFDLKNGNSLLEVTKSMLDRLGMVALWQLAGGKLYGAAVDRIICVEPRDGTIEHTYEAQGEFNRTCSIPAISTDELIVSTSGGSFVLDRNTLETHKQLAKSSPSKAPLQSTPVAIDDVIFLPVPQGILVLRRDTFEQIQEIRGGSVPVYAGKYLLAWEDLSGVIGGRTLLVKWRIACHGIQ